MRALIVAASFSTVLSTGLWALPASAAVPPDPVPGREDTCGAGAYQYLVGKPKSEIPSKPPGAIWRVVSNTQPVTQDFVAARLDIIWDAETKRVVKVHCG
ncbi:MAG TPA: hypothetical protein VG407_10170 [Caulobacteraceae bacterium]|jgi:hypothetical protein|nr:hypothetical protein [Caulobacteraceae bacterium]